MEYKCTCLRKVLARNELGISIENYKEMKAIEPQSRSCYREEDHIHMKSNEFVEMMVLDGCFVVHLLQRNYCKEFDDPIYSNFWTLPRIAHTCFSSRINFLFLSWNAYGISLVYQRLV